VSARKSCALRIATIAAKAITTIVDHVQGSPLFDEVAVFFTLINLCSDGLGQLSNKFAENWSS